MDRTTISGASTRGLALVDFSSSSAPVQGRFEDTAYLIDDATAMSPPSQSYLLVDVRKLQFTGGTGNDTVVGFDGADTLTGGAGRDLLSGGGGSNRLFGGEDADTLIGGTGRSLLDGGAGDDMLVAGRSSLDTVVGGAGNDIIVLSAADRAGPVTGGFDAGGAFLITIAGAEPSSPRILTITGVERASITGSRYDDDLLGLAAADTLLGGAGDDSADGGGGDDRLFGEAGADTLFGGAGNDGLDGGAGDDMLVSTAGFDMLDGGRGNDLAVLDFSSATSRVANASGLPRGVYAISDSSAMMPATHAITIVGIERASIIGGSAGDAVTGMAGADTVMGGAGGDLLDGRFGDDVLHGEAGADTLRGGAGQNVLDGGADDDVLFSVSGEFTGGGALPDMLFGGPGDDLGVLDFSTSTARVTLQSGTVSDFAIADGSGPLSPTHAAMITGVERFSVIGGRGNDMLDSGGGADTITAGLGDDKVDGGGGADRLFGEAGADTLFGGAGNDSFDGGAGDDMLVSTAGFDMLEGGRGNDLAVLDFSSATQAVSGFTALAGGYFVITDGSAMAPATRGLTIHGFERVSIIGGGGADSLLAVSGAATLAGGGGNDSLRGGNGDDRLEGGAGPDRLVGGNGRDTFVFHTLAEGGDAIADFTAGVDRLEIDAQAFPGGGVVVATGDLTGDGVFVVNPGGTPTAAHAQFLYETNRGRLWWDSDGTGDAVRVLLVTLMGRPMLTADDLQLP